MDLQDRLPGGEPICQGALPLLLEGANRLGIRLAKTQAEAFVAYCSLLLERNLHVNLTGVRTPEGVMTTLFLDSLTVLLALPDDWVSKPIAACDVGTGAGFPGLPLKITCPSWKLTLIESVGKKAAFLRELIDALAISRVDVLPVRAELVASRRQARDSMDLCCARAVASLPSLIELCAPLVRTGGLLVFPRSGDLAAELLDAKVAARALKVSPRPLVPVPTSLGLGKERALVVYEKDGETPSHFPRRVGMATSKPFR
jgi:16S rRNA (guanine527-N7)-methyltransferase